MNNDKHYEFRRGHIYVNKYTNKYILVDSLEEYTVHQDRIIKYFDIDKPDLIKRHIMARRDWILVSG